MYVNIWYIEKDKLVIWKSLHGKIDIPSTRHLNKSIRLDLISCGISTIIHYSLITKIVSDTMVTYLDLIHVAVLDLKCTLLT